MGRVLVEAGCAVVMEHWREFAGCLEGIQRMVEEA
jgi:hypothetical protein